MRRAILILTLCGTCLFAGPVFFSKSGKTYHQERNCSLLSRAHDVYSADEKDAESHGLHKCGRCYGEKKAGGKSNAAWAKKVTQ